METRQVGMVGQVGICNMEVRQVGKYGGETGRYVIRR